MKLIRKKLNKYNNSTRINYYLTGAAFSMYHDKIADVLIQVDDCVRNFLVDDFIK